MAEQLAAKMAAINKGVEIDESKLGSGGGDGDGESLPLNISSEKLTPLRDSWAKKTLSKLLVEIPSVRWQRRSTTSKGGSTASNGYVCGDGIVSACLVVYSFDSSIVSLFYVSLYLKDPRETLF